MEGNQPKLHHLQSGYLLVTDTTHKELCTLPPLLFWVSQLVLPFLAGHRPSDSHVTHRDGSLQPPRPPGIPITGTHSGKPILPFPPTQPGWINLRQLAAFFPRKAVPRRRSRAASSPSHSAIQMPTVPTKILTLCHGRTARSGTGTPWDRHRSPNTASLFTPTGIHPSGTDPGPQPTGCTDPGKDGAAYCSGPTQGHSAQSQVCCLG